MFKEKVIKGLICLGVIGMLASSAWAVGKKPAQEQADVKKAQAKAQSETEKESIKETEEKGTQAVEAQAIEPKLIMEYKLPEGEEIVDVIFDEATMTVKEARALGVKGLGKRSAKEIVKVQYPKVVVLGKIMKYVKSEGGYPYAEDFEEIHPALIRFFSEKGKIKKEISLQEITPKGWRTKIGFPKNKKYIGVTSEIVRYCQEWLDEGPSEAKFTMIDTNGQILWEAVSNLGEPFGISPNGQYIVCTGDTTGDYWDYIPSVWNKKGIIKKLFGEEEIYFEVDKINFSKDGDFFAVIVGNVKGLPLIVFDDKGNELWRRETIGEGKGWEIGDIYISDDDMITTTSWNFYTGEVIKLYFDKKGNLIEPKPKEEK